MIPDPVPEKVGLGGKIVGERKFCDGNSEVGRGLVLLREDTRGPTNRTGRRCCDSRTPGVPRSLTVPPCRVRVPSSRRTAWGVEVESVPESVPRPHTRDCSCFHRTSRCPVMVTGDPRVSWSYVSDLVSSLSLSKDSPTLRCRCLLELRFRSTRLRSH